MNQISSAGDEIVNFPLPKRYLPVVIQALAKAMGEDISPENESEKDVKAESEVSVPTQKTKKIDWTKVENAKKLQNAVRNLPIAFYLFETTLENEGEWVPFSDIYPKAGFTKTGSAGSSLGALTKIIKREFGINYEDVTWPVWREWGVKGDSQYYYKMQGEIAQAWRDAQSS